MHSPNIREGSDDHGNADQYYVTFGDFILFILLPFLVN